MDREKDRRRKREVDLMAVDALVAVPVLAPNLLHVVEKSNRQRERQKEKERGTIDLMAVGAVSAVPVLAPNPTQPNPPNPREKETEEREGERER